MVTETLLLQTVSGAERRRCCRLPASRQTPAGRQRRGCGLPVTWSRATNRVIHSFDVEIGGEQISSDLLPVVTHDGCVEISKEQGIQNITVVTRRQHLRNL